MSRTPVPVVPVEERPLTPEQRLRVTKTYRDALARDKDAFGGTDVIPHFAVCECGGITNLFSTPRGNGLVPLAPLVVQWYVCSRCVDMRERFPAVFWWVRDMLEFSRA